MRVFCERLSSAVALKFKRCAFCMSRLFVVLCCVLAMALPRPAVASDSKEYLVKAAFIYNFVKFVEWPGDMAVAKQSKLDICVLGKNVLSSAGSIFKKASTPSLKLNLQTESSAAAAAEHCHIVYISASEAGREKEILSQLKGKPVLVVGDVPEFIQNNGMIGFVLRDDKVKLTINRRAIEAAGLRVDAQLLEIALEVIR